MTEPPLLTADLPGVGGRVKDRPEDFEVEEIPAYEPAGTGDHLFLWVEKTDLAAEQLVKRLAVRLGVSPRDVGAAGLKDRRAVTRQWLSVPKQAEANLAAADGNGIRVLTVSRHGNKLRPGHLRGNRFRVLVRDADRANTDALAAVVARLREKGLPNYYGPQRFGRGGETLALGRGMLRGDVKPVRNPFLKKLALSSAQSAMFNDYLGRRLTDGLLHTVLDGDVMAKRPAGGMFVAEDVPAEQRRFDAGETVPAGPIFGRKTFPARAAAAEREAAVLADAGLPEGAFGRFGKLLPGTRRHTLVFPDDLAAEWEPEGVRVTVTLPAGSYMTVLLRELTKSAAGDPDAADADGA